MNESATTVHRGRWRAAAWLWLAAVVAVACHQWRFWHMAHFETDILALLPQDEQAPEVGIATRQLTDQVTRQVVVMIGAPDWASATCSPCASRKRAATRR